MPAILRTTFGTQRAFSRVSIPLLTVQESTSIFRKDTKKWMKNLAFCAAILGLSTSAFCTRKLMSEDCDSLHKVLRRKVTLPSTSSSEERDSFVVISVDDIKGNANDK